jgi:hypothetical protein
LCADEVILGGFVQKFTLVLVGIVICVGQGRAQSVAQTLVTLTSKVGDLEKRPVGGGMGSPLVDAMTQEAGGRIDIYDSQHREAASIHVDKGGRFVARTAGDARALVGVGDTGYGGLWIYAQGGKKILASFGTAAGGASGAVEVNGTTVHDYAEVFDIADCHGLLPGSVVATSDDGKGIQLSSHAYDPATTGVLSGAGSFQSGMRIGSREDGSTNFPVAVAGQVYVRVNAEAGPISVGDLLVSSGVPGVAMRGADANRLTGTVIGKALQPYAGSGEALVRMLVLNR